MSANVVVQGTKGFGSFGGATIAIERGGGLGGFGAAAPVKVDDAVYSNWDYNQSNAWDAATPVVKAQFAEAMKLRMPINVAMLGVGIGALAMGPKPAKVVGGIVATLGAVWLAISGKFGPGEGPFKWEDDTAWKSVAAGWSK